MNASQLFSNIVSNPLYLLVTVVFLVVFGRFLVRIGWRLLVFSAKALMVLIVVWIIVTAIATK